MPSMKTRSRPSLYSVHPGVAMVAKAIAGLKEKTGRDLGGWIAFIKKHGPPGESERRDWLKREHRLGTNYAWWLAERAEGKGEEDADPEAYLRAAETYVLVMFAGKKAGLRPIYDRLLALALALGDDVKACPCKTIVPLYRNHVFAEIKPTTQTRIDFGLALGGTARTPKRLLPTGGAAKRDRITHRFPITSPAEIDGEVERWLRRAYEMDA